MRLDVNPVAPLTKDSHEVKWEITAQGEGSGLLLVEAPSELDPSEPESRLYWGSKYHQACNVLVSVLGIPYKLYVLLCLFFTVAGVGAFIRWMVGRKNKP